MPKYDLYYVMSEGSFMMEVCTGYTIISENNKMAMKAAEHLANLLSESFILRCGFCLTPKPHLTVQGINQKHYSSIRPQTIRFQIQRNFHSPNKLLGYPVFNDDDFQDVTESKFIEELGKEYSDHLKTTNKACLEFECIGYGVINQALK